MSINIEREILLLRQRNARVRVIWIGGFHEFAKGKWNLTSFNCLTSWLFPESLDDYLAEKFKWWYDASHFSEVEEVVGFCCCLTAAVPIERFPFTYEIFFSPLILLFSSVYEILILPFLISRVFFLILRYWLKMRYYCLIYWKSLERAF